MNFWQVIVRVDGRTHVYNFQHESHVRESIKATYSMLSPDSYKVSNLMSKIEVHEGDRLVIEATNLFFDNLYDRPTHF